MVLELRVEFRDDGLVTACDGHDSELLSVFGCRRTELRHIHTYERGVLVKLEHSDLELSSCKVHRLA